MSLNFTIRELQLEDLKAGSGFYETLENLSPAPVPDTQLGRYRAKRAFKMNVKLEKTVWVAIAEDSQIVGTTSFFIEYKFTRDGGIVGHIEDVVIRKGWEGNHIARRLIHCAISAARGAGCYKVILDCNKKNEDFYRVFDFYAHETMMRLDLM